MCVDFNFSFAEFVKPVTRVFCLIHFPRSLQATCTFLQRKHFLIAKTNYSVHVSVEEKVQWLQMSLRSKLVLYFSKNEERHWKGVIRRERIKYWKLSCVKCPQIFYVNSPCELLCLSKNNKMINGNMYCELKMIFVNKLR